MLSYLLGRKAEFDEADSSGEEQEACPRSLRHAVHPQAAYFYFRLESEMSRKPFTILVSIPLKPGRAAEFLALLHDVFDAKVEDTFVNATALRSADDPDTIMLVETWLDRENFMSVQMKRPYRGRYEARLPELLRTPREVTFYEPIRSMP
jgi:quinol monooxygenase YgiN